MMRTLVGLAVVGFVVWGLLYARVEPIKYSARLAAERRQQIEHERRRGEAERKSQELWRDVPRLKDGRFLGG